jgi:hypothetical protein
MIPELAADDEVGDSSIASIPTLSSPTKFVRNDSKHDTEQAEGVPTDGQIAN